MKKKITTAKPEGLTRLKAIELVQDGLTLREVGQQFGVHYTTISEWMDMYETGGIERLNAPMKPRPKHTLDPAEIQSCINLTSEKYHARLKRLLRLANGEQLKAIALSEGVSVQAIMKDRRLFEAGSLPLSISL